MFRKTWFWVIFTILVIMSIFYILRYFPKVMSFINLDITMDRKTAMEEAAVLCEKYNLGPEDYQQVPIFDHDGYTQIYIELEGGGKEVYNEMIKGDLYKPYKWEVRHFKEGETKEVTFYFTPQGEPYGFQERLPETETGDLITFEQAQVTAEEFARNEFNVNLEEFELVETPKEEVLSGRVDYTFVYERPDIKINEARYRFKITVSGNKVTELYYFMKIPEAFGRRYSEMRSANNTIAMGGLIGMAIFYGLGGIILGIFLLLRNHWLLWRKAVMWAFIVAFLGFLARFNFLPLSWNWYDTAITKNAFLFHQIIQALLSFLGDFILLALSFMTAESLTRKAFPNRIQFWKVWSKGVANSGQILGNTIAGYFVPVLSLVYILFFYFITTKNFGWWNPSSLITNPNTIATIAPWFSAIANALHAGFWEECLFRAVPIAGMAIIGSKLGKRKLFIGIGLILQALIFGAAHANYAAQPAYARLVELFIPSLYFAFLYLRFGLLTAILMHFIFDAVLMSLPIWVTSTRGIWVGRILFMVLFFIPVFIVLYRRIQARKWVRIAEDKYNKTWKPVPGKEKIAEHKEIYSSSTFNKRSTKWIFIFGIIGILLWIVFTNFHDLTIPIRAGRKQAIESAKVELKNQGIELSDEWKVLTQTFNSANNIDRFIWQEGGKELYENYIGKYIPSARWRVRFVKFEGDVAERAEEYLFFINGEGKVYSYSHTLPEDMEGAVLEKEKAQELSYLAISEQFGLDPLQLKEISAIPEKLPNRKDWSFTYSDTINYTLPEGELRYFVGIAGEKIIRVWRYIYVPEEWTREYTNISKPANTFKSLFIMIIFIVYFFAVVLAIINWSKKKFSFKTFILFLIFLFILQIVVFFNGWSTEIANFSTSQPFGNQVFSSVFGFGLKAIFFSFALAVIMGYIKNQQVKISETKNIFIPSFGWGAGFIGVLAILSLFAPSLAPIRPDVNRWADYLPFVGVFLKPLFSYFSMTILVIFLVMIINKLTGSWTEKKWIGIILILIITLDLAASKLLEVITTETILNCLITGLVVGLLILLVYVNFCRFKMASIPVITGVVYLFNTLKQGLYAPYPVALAGSVASAVIIVAISIYWSKLLNKKE